MPIKWSSEQVQRQCPIQLRNLPAFEAGRPGHTSAYSPPEAASVPDWRFSYRADSASNVECSLPQFYHLASLTRRTDMDENNRRLLPYSYDYTQYENSPNIPCI